MRGFGRFKKYAMKNKFRSTAVVGLIALVVYAMSGFILIKDARAAALTSKSDTMSRLQASVASNHTIQFTTPTGVAAGATITVTFPAGFNMGSVAFGDMDLEDDGSDVTLAATPSGTTWGAAVAGQVITFTNGSAAVAADSVITIEIGTNATGGSNQITNTASTGDATISIGGTFGDSGDILVEILADDTVNITATVDEAISFSISDTSIGFGTLTSANARYATSDANGDTTAQVAHNLVAGTNATGGYTITVQGATLTSGSDTIDAMAVEATSSAGTEQFGIRMTATGGSGTVDSDYDNSPADSYFFGANATTVDDVASSTGATADTTYSCYYLANIASNTEAGSYSTDLTYVATAQF